MIYYGWYFYERGGNSNVRGDTERLEVAKLSEKMVVDDEDRGLGCIFLFFSFSL